MIFDHQLGTPLGFYRKPSKVETAKRFLRVSEIRFWEVWQLCRSMRTRFWMMCKMHDCYWARLSKSPLHWKALEKWKMLSVTYIQMMQAAPLNTFERDSRVPLDQIVSIYIICERIKRLSVLRRNITAALCLLNTLIKRELSLLSHRFVLIALCKIQLLVCLKSVQKHIP